MLIFNRLYIILLIPIWFISIEAVRGQDRHVNDPLPGAFTMVQSPGQPGLPGIKKPSWPASTFHFNPLGFAMMGPIFQFEFNAAGGFYIVPSLRYGYAGWVAHETWTRSESDSKYSPATIGLGVGVRQFFQVQKRGRAIYVGGFAEYSYDKASHNIDTDWESEQVHHGISVLANLGYRHWFRRNLFLQLGVYIGPSFDLKNESVYVTGPEEGYVEKDLKGVWFVPLIDFALGWNLD